MVSEPRFTTPAAVHPEHIELPDWSADPHDSPFNHGYEKHHRIAVGGRVIEQPRRTDDRHGDRPAR